MNHIQLLCLLLVGVIVRAAEGGHMYRLVCVLKRAERVSNAEKPRDLIRAVLLRQRQQFRKLKIPVLDCTMHRKTPDWRSEFRHRSLFDVRVRIGEGIY